jgi:hypothetical protein
MGSPVGDPVPVCRALRRCRRRMVPGHKHWVSPRCDGLFLPVAVLSKVFRGKFVGAFEQAFTTGKLHFHGQLQSLAETKVFRKFLRQLFRRRWIVYCKPPLAARIKYSVTSAEHGGRSP